MGWDSFGLPAENAAIKHGVSPQEWTNKNIQEMKNQLQNLGFDFDWERELATHQPEYYKHTQYIFSELYKRGLAYKKEAYVNWDPEDQTVLANEQIDANGRSWRSGAKVEKKLLSQWFLKIRFYADEMLDDLNNLEKWPETVKEAQRGWIGKSQGANITFSLRLIGGQEIPLTVFTTRPDTIYGVTFVGISHENPIIQKHLLKNNQIDENAYERYLQRLDILQSQGKDLKQIDVESIDEGLLLQNIKAIHPLTNQELPVYLTTYVLNDYGTGAIMGVPFHDERDCAFALKNNLSMIQVLEEGREEEQDIDQMVLANSGPFTGLSRKDGTLQIIKKLEQEGKGRITNEYRLKDWLVSRQRYWGVPIPIIYKEDCKTCHIIDDNLPVILPQIDQEISLLKQGQSLSKVERFLKVRCPNCGKDAKREVDTLDTFVDSSWYFLRFLDSHNSHHPFDVQTIKSMMPVDIYVGGMEHAIMHLLYARFIHKFLCDINGITHENGSFNHLREPFKELIVQGLVKSKTYKLKSNGKYLFPSEIKNFTNDEIEVSFEKMSKSKGNGVSPNTITDKYGVDTLRLALMFGAPPDMDVNFDEDFIQSMKKFLDRLSRMGESLTQNKRDNLMKRHEIHETYREQLIPILELLADYQNKLTNQRHFHVSVARIMELCNLLQKIKNNHDVEALGYIYMIQALYPFCPHLCCEIWENLENSASLVSKLGFDKDLRKSQQENMKQLLEQLQQTVKLRINLDGKSLGIINVPKSLMGDAQGIFEFIIQNKPSEIKKLEEFLKRERIQNFKGVIALKEKPIVNFVTI